ncbi:MAG: beta-lactamase family protein [Actinobacteria bacterium]|nr:beta-lactamase family protein [Actinomycetota bacterium]
MAALDEVHGWLERELPALLREYGVPAASVAVMVGEHRRMVAAGVLNLETGVEATTDAVFQIGSVTKVFTATLVMQLVDEGLLSLDDTVQSVLPGFRVADPEASRVVTVRHLLTHTSGFEGDIFTDTGEGADYLERYVALLVTAPQLFPVGEQFSYNNAGICVLGRIVEVLRGAPFDECFRAHLLDPLGLDFASLNAAEAILHRAAVGHIAGQEPSPAGAGQLSVTPVWAMARSNAPAGSMLAMRAEDLLTFARMHLDAGRSAASHQVLSPESVAAMQQKHVMLPDIGWGEAWGLGWDVTETSEGMVIGHDGSTIGQSSTFRVIPGRDAAFAVLTNGGQMKGLIEALSRRLLADIANVAPVEAIEPAPGAKPPLNRERYIGRYGSSTVEHEVFWSEEDASLRLRSTPLGELAELGEEVTEVELVAWRGDTLISLTPERGRYAPIAFLGDDGSGRAEYLHSGRADKRVNA